ncbi:HK97 family phage prohead protease [uncultured Bradyrhizobium sp.]|uniref:HK97 family phage prohead protease n=1 Tax=uncultured Bradyrhizobium sp. TaxID=199684 RepID=UPI00341B5CBE
MIDEPTTIAEGYFEKIVPGAFAKTTQNGHVLALIAHDWARVVARQTAGTLRLKDTPIGLAFELDADLSPSAIRTSCGI